MDSDLHIASYGDNIEDTEVIEIVNDIFLKAMVKQASDIHIEPRERNIQVRFRVD
jgi:type II secretory ATPase GspE/PulE/Tfp pilus assembly ATPase PilB-like protein